MQFRLSSKIKLKNKLSLLPALRSIHLLIITFQSLLSNGRESLQNPGLYVYIPMYIDMWIRSDCCWGRLMVQVYLYQSYKRFTTGYLELASCR